MVWTRKNSVFFISADETTTKDYHQIMLAAERQRLRAALEEKS